MNAEPLEQIGGFLPRRLRDALMGVPGVVRPRVEEIRLRVGRPMYLTLDGGEFCPRPAVIPTTEDLHTVLELASDHSVHAALERMRGGFITVNGGHRIGICGETIAENGKILGFRRPSSLNIRVAREVKTAAEGLLPCLLKEDRLPNTLIAAPPGAGKTTLLRDLIRRLSCGEGIRGQRVGVVDERGEIGAVWAGMPQMDLGPRTDILDGTPKAEGLLLMLRGMNPQILAVDEITHPDDIRAITLAAGCGVSVLATIHGKSRTELLTRPLCRELLEQNMFRQIVTVERGKNGERFWKVEEIK